MAPAPGPVRIDEPGDARLHDYRQLKDPARARRELERQVFVVEGRLAVAALVASAHEVVSLLVDDHQVGSVAGLVDAVVATGAPVYVGTRAVVAETVGFDLHRGVVAVGRRPAPASPGAVAARALAAGPGAPAVVVVLEGLGDHENLGAVFRNAAAFGAAAVLLDPTCADPLYRRSVRVSLGHVLAVPFARMERWPDGLGELRAAGFFVAALAPERPGDTGTGARAPRCTVRELAHRRPDGPVALVAGAEGPGLSAAARRAADVLVAVPMAAGVDSLNVATATAIALYELAGRHVPAPG